MFSFKKFLIPVFKPAFIIFPLFPIFVHKSFVFGISSFIFRFPTLSLVFDVVHACFTRILTSRPNLLFRLLMASEDFELVTSGLQLKTESAKKKSSFCCGS